MMFVTQVFRLKDYRLSLISIYTNSDPDRSHTADSHSARHRCQFQHLHPLLLHHLHLLHLLLLLLHHQAVSPASKEEPKQKPSILWCQGLTPISMMT